MKKIIEAVKKIILARQIRKLRTELRYFGIDCTTITDEQMIERIINFGRESSKCGTTIKEIKLLKNNAIKLGNTTDQAVEAMKTIIKN